jgi:hypothetical protein
MSRDGQQGARFVGLVETQQEEGPPAVRIQLHWIINIAVRARSPGATDPELPPGSVMPPDAKQPRGLAARVPPRHASWARLARLAPQESWTNITAIHNINRTLNLPGTAS